MTTEPSAPPQQWRRWLAGCGRGPASASARPSCPTHSVVLDGRTARGGPGVTVADCCCPHINFHIDRAAADATAGPIPG
jgi:hypothetical protein